MCAQATLPGWPSPCVYHTSHTVGQTLTVCASHKSHVRRAPTVCASHKSHCRVGPHWVYITQVTCQAGPHCVCITQATLSGGHSLCIRLGRKCKSQKQKETYYFLQDMLSPSKQLCDKGPINGSKTSSPQLLETPHLLYKALCKALPGCLVPP